MREPSPLPVRALRWRCPPGALRPRRACFDPTFGQEAAVDALRTALGTRVPQHAFVSADDDGTRLPLVLGLLRRATASPSSSRRIPRIRVAHDLSREGLFGRPESPSDPRAASGTPRGGAFWRADGGVLVIEVDEIARDPARWAALRSALRDPGVLVPPNGPRAVLVGEERTYAALFDEDPAFGEVVPVKATLESRARATPRAIRAVAAFAAQVATEEHLRPLAPSATAAVVEESVREAGGRGRLSLRFARAARWLREADQRAAARRARRIEARDVLDARRRESERLGVAERRVFGAVLEGVVLIATRGRARGQVNGLAVHDYGELGKVARITATVGAGREGVVNVEREVALSSASYDKGVHVLAGYLTDLLACTRAAALSVRIVFEQSYGHLSGDSATCAEACAVLSALSEAPLRQDLAITGSMNQHGRVQAIGGVNEKIEGFYDLCAARGLTGTQGVVVPRSNVEDLVLRPDVVEACARGRFRVHAIETVEEGLSLLAGRPAGKTSVPGRFRRGSVLDAASKRVEHLSSLAT